MTNSISTLLVRALSTLLLSLMFAASLADVMVETTAQLDVARVTFLLPHALKVGDSPALDVIVTPADGQPSPSNVRGRIGMPDMGHWITEESAMSYSSDGHQFAGDFPHPGIYRLRIWLDYEDGTTVKTAIDFTVASGHELAPEVVP